MNLLQALKRRRYDKEQIASLSGWDRYRQLLADIADGREVDVDTAAEIIAENKKTDDELASDVERLEQRIDRYRLFERGKDGNQRLRTATQQLEALDEQVAAFHAKLAPKFDAAREARDQAEREAIQAESAKAYLHQTAMNPALKSQIDAAAKERAELGQELRATNESIDRLNIDYYRSRLHSAEQKQKRPPKGFTAQAAAAQVQLLAEETDACRQALQPRIEQKTKLGVTQRRLETQIAEINARLEALFEETLLP